MMNENHVLQMAWVDCFFLRPLFGKVLLGILSLRWTTSARTILPVEILFRRTFPHATVTPSGILRRGQPEKKIFTQELAALGAAHRKLLRRWLIPLLAWIGHCVNFDFCGPSWAFCGANSVLRQGSRVRRITGDVFFKIVFFF